MAQRYGYGYNNPPTYHPYRPQPPVAAPATGATPAPVSSAGRMGGGPAADPEIAGYQQQQQQLAQNYQIMSGLQNQLNTMVQADPGAALYQQLLGLYNTNLGQKQQQELLDLNKPVNQQSTGAYFVGY